MIPKEWIDDVLRLKRFPRTGWLRVGVRAPESVADHVFAAAILGWRIARETPDVDAARVTAMLLAHDLLEARLSDIPTPAKKYFPSDCLDRAEERIVEEQWADDPHGAELVREFLEGRTPEAALARAVDHLEFVLEAAGLVRAGSTGPREMLARAREGAAAKHPATRPYLDAALAETSSGTPRV
jgi:putative hydrolase of HD superfamily